MSNIDFDKVIFSTLWPIDKVVDNPSASISILNDGLATSAQKAKVTSTEIDNPHGRKALVRAVWSVDGGVNWQSLDSQLIYSFTHTVTPPGVSVTLSGLRAAVSVGVSDEKIKFITASGYHGNSSNTGGPDIFTPIPQTFLIKYAIYEIN